jgi:hypothetical protein
MANTNLPTAFAPNREPSKLTLDESAPTDQDSAHADVVTLTCSGAVPPPGRSAFAIP